MYNIKVFQLCLPSLMKATHTITLNKFKAIDEYRLQQSSEV